MIEWMRREFPRYFAGFILMATGLGKVLDIPGFVTVIEAYQLFPHRAAVLLAYILPFIELGTGFCLASGRFLLSGASLAVGLHAVMIGAVVITLIRGIPVENCGCFGVFFARPLSYTTLIEDLVMLAMSGWVWINARSLSEK
ncbi:MAG: MauE/DoxX family redox-associated membrane protein [Methylococcales bacterium]